MRNRIHLSFLHLVYFDWICCFHTWTHDRNAPCLDWVQARIAVDAATSAYSHLQYWAPAVTVYTILARYWCLRSPSDSYCLNHPRTVSVLRQLQMSSAVWPVRFLISTSVRAMPRNSLISPPRAMTCVAGSSPRCPGFGRLPVAFDRPYGSPEAPCSLRGRWNHRYWCLSCYQDWILSRSDLDSLSWI